MRHNKELYNDIIKWDVATWKVALNYWNKILPSSLSSFKCLELGAGDGGITLYLALKGGSVICSDIKISNMAKILHKKYNVAHLVKYENIDATNIPYPDNHFNIVTFKSMLGAIGRNNNKAKQKIAIQEIYRILKPNGIFLFAENLKGSFLHMLLRKKFVRWGKSWRYISIEEMKEFTSCFSSFKYLTVGFLGAFGRTESQRKVLYLLDKIVELFIREKDKYVIYGYARK
jgi:ubiquinone/menaquinone biosynthesis C-methylase UbiE